MEEKRRRKQIRFDLPIDGVKVASLDELQEHFSTEIIGHFRSGLLAKWLRPRRLIKELAAVKSLNADDDASILMELCRIFGVEADAQSVAATLAEATGVPGIRPQHPKKSGGMNELWEWFFTTAISCLARGARVKLKESDLKELWRLFVEVPESDQKLADIKKELVGWFCSMVHRQYLTQNKLPSGNPTTKWKWHLYIQRYIRVMDSAFSTSERCPDEEVRRDLTQRLGEQLVFAHQLNTDGVDRGLLDKDALERAVRRWREEALKKEW